MEIAYILVFAVILFMLWTTFSQQRKSKRAQEELVRMLKKGDEVLTVGGLFGTIRRIADDHVILELEDGGRAKVLKRAIRQIVDEDADDYDDDEPYEDEDEYEEYDDEDDVEEDVDETDAEEVEEAVGEAADEGVVEPPEPPQPPTPPRGKNE